MNIKVVAPVILTIVGCAATVGAVVLSAIETPDAIKVLDDHRLAIDPSGESDLCMQEKVVDYAKSYKKTIACTAMSLACAVGACVLGSKNYKLLLKSSAATAALSTAYTSKYRSKIRKILGNEKERLIHKEVQKELSDGKFTDAVVFHYDFPNDENGVPLYEAIEFKSSLQTMYEQYIDCMRKIANGEVMSVGEVFPQLSQAIGRHDPRQYQLDKMWHQDILLEGYDIMVPTITFDPVNFQGSENENGSPLINDGKPAYVIHLYEEPEPPECIMTADC